MKTFEVNAKSGAYPIYIEEGFGGLLKAFETAHLTGVKGIIICDTNTERLYLNQVKDLLKDSFLSLCSVSFEAGEERKNLDTIITFYKTMVENGLDRKSVVIALGGGVVGDMAGFAAATYMRGIKYVQIPTTLLAQVDSSVGGKTAVDFMGNKNMVGAFYQPSFVYMNTETLNTLPYREVAAGMAEVIKHGLIIDNDYLEMLKRDKADINALKPEAVREVLYGSCKAKSFVVSKDEKETGLREILNYGHTFGHAVESLLEFKLLHGECVAIGMAAALSLSLKRGVITQEEYAEIIDLIQYFGLETKAQGVNSEQVYSQMLKDKKTKNNVVTLVLLEKIGRAYRDSNVATEDIFEAIETVVER
ncbi:MAG: 3-dehydroquinate synthase [Eubacterium sp.]|nr:3-dehydroquinate synthase [Eubacterium sp.]